MIRAGSSAERLGQLYIGTEHLLLALAEDPDGVAGQILERLGVRSAVKEELAAFIESSRPSTGPPDRGDEVRVGFRPDQHGNPQIVVLDR